MALPYDATPPPEAAHPEVAAPQGPQGLDQALDDYDPAIPDHVKSLMGRMSNKVYLMEETPAILHMDGEKRLKKDLKLRKLAEDLDQQDPSPWLEEITQGSEERIKTQALYVHSELIQHMSTAKIFTWCSQLGSKPMGIEWINDTTLHLLFPTPAEALLSLALLSKTGFDMTEDDPLLDRSAHSFPVSLLPRADVGDSVGTGTIATTKSDSLGESENVLKRGRGMFARRRSPVRDEASSQPSVTIEDITLAPGVNPFARIALRYGLESDQSHRKGGQESEWYRKHGFSAGKEVASHSRPGFDSHERQKGHGDIPHTWERGVDAVELASGGRDLYRRLGRERKPYDRPPPNRRKRADRGKLSQEDLDKELEAIRSGETMDIDVDYGREEPTVRKNRGFQRGGVRRERDKDDLDRELDELFAARPGP
ncbi:hypothetical protein L204_104583 [Cryptococcus depauperatus]|nr:hypothetical protein L204_03446 [Cryptococcus depauperatus CBS 7855]